MKAKNLKRSFLLSVLSLVLCVSMFVGTTFAWFTDTVKSEKNKIMAGNLDVELYYQVEGSDKWEKVTSSTNIFKEDTLWEPGHTEVVKLKVVNEGTLALKYQLGVNIYDEEGSVNQLGKEFKLSDYIKYGITDQTVASGRDAAIAAVDATAKPLNVDYTEAGTLLAEGESVVTMVVYMPTTVGNEANAADKNNTPYIYLGLNLYATQVANEEDSFDKYYDAGTVWYGESDVSWYDPAATEYTIASPEQFAGLAEIVNGTAKAPVTTFAAESTATTIHDDFKGKTVYLNLDIDLNDTAWTPIGTFADFTKTTDFTYAFQGTFDGQNHTISNLTVSNQGWAGLFGIAYKATIKNVKVVGVELESSRMTGAIVGQLYGSIDNCHVVDADITVTPNAVKDGYDNGDKVGGIVGWIGDNNNNHSLTNCTAEGVTVKGYRDIGGIAGYVAWSTVLENNKVTTAILTGDQSVNFYGHKEYNVGAIWGRNSESGTGAGVVDKGGNTHTGVEIITVNVIASAGDLSAALTAGGKHKLAKDLALDASYTVANGVSVELDLNGKTIAGTNSGTATHNDLFLVKGNLTVKNGTVTQTHAASNMGWNGCTNTFDVTAGGVLDLNDVTVENLGGTDMNFAIHMNNWGEVTLNADNCVLKATYMPVRVFNSGPDMNNVTIENSVLESTGGNYSFWVHNYASADFGGKLYSAAAQAYDEAKVAARLNFDILGNNNTFITGKAAPIRYGFYESLIFDDGGSKVITAATKDELQAALDNAVDGNVIKLTADIEGDVTITQKADTKVVIDGDGNTFAGIMTVFGNGRKTTAALTIKHIDFVAATGAASCIVSPDRTINNAYSYSSNVTVENCTFTDPDGVVNCAAVRHEDGGDSNWKIVDCVVDNTMHSLIQTNNVELNGLTIQGCKVNSKNGINLNQCTKVSIIDCEIDVKGYAVRYGVSGATVNGNFEIKDSTLKSANDDGDAVIIFRGTMSGSTLTITNTTLDGDPEITGNANVVKN